MTPRFREALLLHYLDDLDSKMEAIRGELASAEQSGRAGEWTDWNRALERPLLDREKSCSKRWQTLRRRDSLRQWAGKEMSAARRKPARKRSSRQPRRQRGQLRQQFLNQVGGARPLHSRARPTSSCRRWSWNA